jgi:hypothetical protein
LDHADDLSDAGKERLDLDAFVRGVARVALGESEGEERCGDGS